MGEQTHLSPKFEHHNNTHARENRSEGLDGERGSRKKDRKGNADKSRKEKGGMQGKGRGLGAKTWDFLHGIFTNVWFTIVGGISLFAWLFKTLASCIEQIGKIFRCCCKRQKRKRQVREDIELGNLQNETARFRQRP
jgi:hypothetical protein